MICTERIRKNEACRLPVHNIDDGFGSRRDEDELFNAPTALDKYAFMVKAMKAYRKGMTPKEPAKALTDVLAGVGFHEKPHEDGCPLTAVCE